MDCLPAPAAATATAAAPPTPAMEAEAEATEATETEASVEEAAAPEESLCLVSYYEGSCCKDCYYCCNSYSTLMQFYYWIAFYRSNVNYQRSDTSNLSSHYCIPFYTSKSFGYVHNLHIYVKSTYTDRMQNVDYKIDWNKNSKPA